MNLLLNRIKLKSYWLSSAGYSLQYNIYVVFQVQASINSHMNRLDRFVNFTKNENSRELFAMRQTDGTSRVRQPGQITQLVWFSQDEGAVQFSKEMLFSFKRNIVHFPRKYCWFWKIYSAVNFSSSCRSRVYANRWHNLHLSKNLNILVQFAKCIFFT